MAITKTQTLTGFHLRNRIRAIFSSTTPVEKLDELKQWAYTDLLELESLPGSDGTIPLKLVRFYQVVSPWCDRSAELYQLERALARIDYGQHNKARDALVALAAREERDLYGVNKTSREQRPSRETTFLGNRRGIWHSVSHWESQRAILATEPDIIGQPDSCTVMEVIDAQASELLDNGIERWTPFLQDLIDS